MVLRFANRNEAARQLAQALESYRGADAIVYALPRGGVVLGAEIARGLKLPLDLVIIRKIGHPLNPEYAVGAVTEAGRLVGNEEELSRLDPVWLAQEISRQRQEAHRRRELYTGNRHLSAAGKIAIIVDDGMATGFTMQAAVLAVQTERPKKIIVAVPVAPHETVTKLRKQAEVIVLDDQDYLGAVGMYYDDFPQVSDEEVIRLLKNL